MKRGALGKQLANPEADLISVAFQLNYDRDLGPHDDGERWTLNVQPVVPADLNQDWNIISRTILPVVLRQQGPWTYGALGNYIWSFAGDDDRDDVSRGFLQPFMSYTTPSAWTFTLKS